MGTQLNLGICGFDGFYGAIGGIKGNVLVAAIAERTVSRSTATAEREGRLSGQVVFVAILIEQFHRAVRVFDFQRSILAHDDFYLGHEASDE
jgi:hypothetical protein